MLSSATDAIIHSPASSGFQALSETLLVWPPWMKRSSGGPSSTSWNHIGIDRMRSYAITCDHMTCDHMRSRWDSKQDMAIEGSN